MKTNIKNIVQSVLFLLPVILGTGCRHYETAQRDLDRILRDFHDELSNTVLITAHRAMHTRYPENSLAAIRHSIESDVDIIELDVRTTKDGRMVLMHDSDLKRTTGATGRVSELTWEQLRSYPLKTKRKESETHHIPLLEEALKLAHGKIMVDLDMKEVHIKPLVEMVHRMGTARQVIFFDSDFGVLDSVLLLDSTLMIMPRAHDTAELGKILQHYNPPVVHIDDSFFTPEVVQTIKKDGARVWINALGIPDILAIAGITRGYKNLVQGGANIIQTDRPLLLKKYLTKKGDR